MHNQREPSYVLAPATSADSDDEVREVRGQTGAREYGAQRSLKWATVLVLGLLAGLVVTAILARPGAPPRVRGPTAQRHSEVARLNEDASDDWDGDTWEDEDWDEGDDAESAPESEPKSEPKSKVKGKPKSSASPKKNSDDSPRNSSFDDDGSDDDFDDDFGADFNDEFDDDFADDFDDDFDDDFGDDFGGVDDEDDEFRSADEEDDDQEDGEEDELADGDEEDATADGEDEVVESGDCADSGHDCSESRCCTQPGEQCYKKNSTWAICRAGCIKDRHVTEEDGQPWSCEALGDRTPGKPQKCSAIGKNCIKSHCCRDIGMQCYQKNNRFASCKPSCHKAMDVMDKDSKPWTCKELGTRRPGVAAWVHEECSQDWSDCSKSKCCKRTGVTCFARDDFWAACLEECTDEKWTCKKLGPPTPPTEAVALENSLPKLKVAPWVVEKCSAMGTNCMETKCCRDAGARCFRKDDSYASCKLDCEKGPDPADKDSKPWECGAVGPRTPGVPGIRVLEGGSKSSWVDDKCADTGSDCSGSRCCKEEGFQCLKDSDKATCRIGCHDCEPLGARTSKAWDTLATLFCFVVVTKDSYEEDILREQLRRRAGIFACDGSAMLGQGDGYTLDVELGGEVVGVKSAHVGVSRDGTAGNTELFINVWDAVKLMDDWKGHGWTIKTDPDAVILPDRLRKALAKVTEDSHMGDELFAYVKTCHKDDGMKNMMFGALEAFSRVAVKKYFENEAKCKQLEWQTWGEDLYMNKCMDNIGAIGMDSFSFVSDDLCNGVDCSDSAAAVFHPMKNLSSWKQCFETAIR